jgi:hypothetical protein
LEIPEDSGRYWYTSIADTERFLENTGYTSIPDTGRF